MGTGGKLFILLVELHIFPSFTSSKFIFISHNIHRKFQLGVKHLWYFLLSGWCWVPCCIYEWLGIGYLYFPQKSWASNLLRIQTGKAYLEDRRWIIFGLSPGWETVLDYPLSYHIILQVVKLLARQTREQREEQINSEMYLEKTAIANQHLSEFCTVLNRILDEDDDTVVWVWVTYANYTVV